MDDRRIIPYIEIQGRRIGSGHPVYIIAEMSANHGQNFNRAIEIMKAAKACGADAIKIQTYTADTITLNCNSEYFQIKGTMWNGKTLHSLYQEAYTPWEWQPKLQKIANEIGLDFFSSPFDETAVDFLENLSVPVYKIASFEIVDIPLIQKIASTGKPIIMSTGMASMDEVKEALATIQAAGGSQVALLKCSSAYPAPVEEVNLKAIPLLRSSFAVPVGFSDHTLGMGVAVAAVSLGACILEKHFTLSRSIPTPDSAFSMEPNEFRQMVESVRIAERSLGQEVLGPSNHEKPSCRFRRSLFVSRDIKAGEIFTSDNMRSVRPADGLHTRHFKEILGKRALRDIPFGTPLKWDMVLQD